nr:MAG TPA: hypothetical protein [Caudoviricetes sp.]
MVPHAGFEPTWYVLEGRCLSSRLMRHNKMAGCMRIV